jgi:error-prone DNA polymerase
LENYHENLFILSDSVPLLNFLRSRVPKESLFVEVQPGPRRRQLLQFARDAGLAPVATNGVYFADGEDFELHRLLRAIHLNTSLSRLDEKELASPNAWLKSSEEMAISFPDYPEALENSRQIAEQCFFDFDLQGPIFPDFDGVRNGKAFEILREQCYRGAQKRYGKITPAVEERLEYELKIIRDKGFAPYFLLVQDIVKQSRRTCGRGSAAASIVSYCLEITHVDPIAHNLFFERFLNMGRKDPPDIDVDELVVQEAYVNEGPRMKRIRPAPMGRAYRYQRRMSHIVVSVAAPGADGEEE